MAGRSDHGYVFDVDHDRYPVAVHVIVRDSDGRVLLMRRAGSGYAEGLLALPAGHVDLGETPTDCAVREVAEELGLGLATATLGSCGVMFRRSQEPRVDIFFTAGEWTGTPSIREPHKCSELVWADPGRLPGDTVDFVGRAVDNARSGRCFDEFGWS